MRYFILAGEASGDRLGGALAYEIVRIQPDAVIAGWGGAMMYEQKVEIVHDIRDLGLMGFKEVLNNAGKLFRLFRKSKRQIESFSPQVVILIDFGGFNLRLISWLKRKAIKVVYYAPPKVWASRSGRIKTLRKCDLCVVNFPFEQEYYRKEGYKVEYFGNPLVHALQHFKADTDFRKKYSIDQRPIIALVPGSRAQEVKTILPLMMSLASEFDEYNWCISGMRQLGVSSYREIIPRKDETNFFLILEDHWNILRHAHAAIVTSGTASLEAALMKVPQVVVYKTGHLNYLIARLLIKTKFISLPNLILNREVVTELIQNDMNLKTLAREFDDILSPEVRAEMCKSYNQIELLLGGKNSAKETAEAIIRLVG